MSKLYSSNNETSPYLLRRSRSLAEVLKLREKRAKARKNLPQVTPGGIVVPLRTIQKTHDHTSDRKTAEDIGDEVLARFRRASEGEEPSPQQTSDFADTSDFAETLDRLDIVHRLDKFAALLRGVGNVGLAQRIERRATDIRKLDGGSSDSDS